MAESGRCRPCSDCWNWFSCCSYGDNMAACRKKYANRRGKQMRKKKKKRQYKKPLRRITIVVTPQTDYHLCEMCAQMGYGEKYRELNESGW